MEYWSRREAAPPTALLLNMVEISTPKVDMPRGPKMAVVTVRRNGTNYADLLNKVKGGIGDDMAEDILLSVRRESAKCLE